MLTLPRSLCFRSVLQEYAKTTTTNFHKIAGKVVGRAGCALCVGGAKPSERGHDNMNAYCANFLQNFLNSRYYFIIIIIIIIVIEIVHVA